MATTNKLNMMFKDIDGKKFTFSLSGVKSDIATQTYKVSDLMASILTCGEIFKNVPLNTDGAQAVTVTETPYEIDD